MVSVKRPDQVLALMSDGRSLPSVLFIFGPDDYTQAQLISQIVDKTLPSSKDRVFGLEEYEAPETDPSHLLGVLKTIPFGLSRKVMVLRRFELAATSVKKADRKSGRGKDSFSGKSASSTPLEEALIRYFKHPSRNTLLLISSLLELKKSHPFTRALPEDALLINCEGLKGRDASVFVKKRLREMGKEATDTWIEQLVEICGTDARKLSGELEKITLLSGDRTALIEDDLKIVSAGEFSRDVFALLDAIVQGSPVAAVEIMRELLGAGEPPLRILSVLLWHYRLVARAFRIKQMGPEGAQLRVHPSRFVTRKVTSHAGHLSQESLRRCFFRLKDTDLLLKSSRLPDIRVMETLVYALAGQNRNLSLRNWRDRS